MLVMDKSENIGKSGDGFIDRSKVRILLCDNDDKSAQEAFTLLCKCSYQVTSVRSPRQVIDALNAEGTDIDIILSEIDLPMSKGLKMLKYIMREKELRRIPVIMMSAQDEVSIVVKCLKFGAADYLMKPLRTNELLNLWTHMWRRRRMLGLAEKNIVNYDFDPVVSDPSDANTNSTTLFSDDTDDKSRKSTNPEACVSTHSQNKNNAIATAATPETATNAPQQCQPDVPGQSDRQRGLISPFAKKIELKIGESSAFFTYVKSTTIKSNNQSLSSLIENGPQHEKTAENVQIVSVQEGSNMRGQDSKVSVENHSEADDYPSSNVPPDSFSVERSSTPTSKDELPQSHMHLRNDAPNDATGCYPHAPYPYYMPGPMNQVTMHPASMYHKNLPDMHNHSNSAIMPQYNHIPMGSYHYYPFSICLQPGQQMPAPHPWPSFGNSTPSEGNNLSVSKVNRREAALMKFRQKRKERCFDKKIRYVNRKKLAERRPRLRGQFVSKVNEINVDLIGQPASAEDDEEEEDEYDDDDPSNVDISPDDDASVCQRSTFLI